MRLCSVVGLVLSLVLALTLRAVEGEWVQVPVIGKKQPPTTTPTPTSTPTPLLDSPVGPPGPNADDVITIRRTVGDSFSNKESVVAAPQSHAGDGAGAGDTDDAQIAVEGEGDAEAAVAADGGAQVDDDAHQADGLPLRDLREAHQTLLKQSTAPVSGKLDFLRRLKNRLLRHIASVAPVSLLNFAGGAAAEAQVEGRGHKGVGFPSNEGTLLSLAFLVFAVFLVKVVMQLIYAVQNNQNYNNNAGVRVAQMQIPADTMMSGGMMPGAMMPAVGSMMGTVMNMVPAMMPPMMAAMDAGMSGGGRDADVARMTGRVLEAIDKAKARLTRRSVDL